MTGTVVTLVLIGCWVGAVFGANSWEVPTTDLRDHINRDLDQDWMIFLKTYNKTYTKTEELTRRFLWEDSLKYISSHNLRYDRDEVTYYLGENEFADMAEDEFMKIYAHGVILPEEEEVYPEARTEPDPEAPRTVDWRKRGLVSGVKNQGQCGSCWAFSAIGSLEGQHKKKTQKMIDLSEQNLVDCANRRYGNYGCRGGWMNRAFKYIQQNRGLDNEQCYPYRARDQRCRYRSSCNSARDHGSRNVGRSESSLQSDLAKVGPIAIAMDVNHRSFMQYRGGIYSEPRCNRYRPGHAMLATGYGSSRGRDYWTVKNSWGTGWGQGGYLFLRRNDGDRCGISRYASYPLV